MRMGSGGKEANEGWESATFRSEPSSDPQSSRTRDWPSHRAPCENSIANMNRPRNFRAYFLLGALVITGLVVLLREHRPSFLRPGLRLYAYVTTADGNGTVVDLVKLKPFSRLYVGACPSGTRRHTHATADPWGGPVGA